MCEADVSHNSPLKPTFCNEEHNFCISVYNIKKNIALLCLIVFLSFECIYTCGFVYELKCTDRLAYEMWLN